MKDQAAIQAKMIDSDEDLSEELLRIVGLITQHRKRLKEISDTNSSISIPYTKRTKTQSVQLPVGVKCKLPRSFFGDGSPVIDAAVPAAAVAPDDEVLAYLSLTNDRDPFVY